MNIMEMTLPEIYESDASTFYRDHWTTCPRKLAEAPVCASAHFAATQLSSRLYRAEAGIIKTIRTATDEIFLAKRAWSDIRADAPPIPSGSRVFILMQNTDEGLEYSLACYERDAIPYLGDVHNLEVAIVCAEQFRVTILMCDTTTLAHLHAEQLIPSTVETIMVIDRSFNMALHAILGTTYHVDAALALPETGVLGTVTNGTLTAAHNTLLESVEGICVATKTHLITPLVRYRTEIPCTAVGQTLYLS